MTNINQQLIADQLGISRTTVSRCFTNHLGINPRTRAKVFDLASQLGYQHMEMRAPVSLRRGGRRTVTVLICAELEKHCHPDHQGPGMELHAGISEYAQIHHLRLNLHYVSPSDQNLEAASYRKVDALWNRGADGLILIYPFPKKVVDDLYLKFPLVSLVEQYGQSYVNCVDADHYKGIGRLVSLLVERGHRRIGFCTRGYEVEAQWSLRRFGAYTEEMFRLGLGFCEQDVVNVRPQHRLSGEETSAHVYKRVQAGVTAWVCAADHQAYDLIADLRQRGLRVPQDVSITGFGAIENSVRAPLLTTARIPYREIGFAGTKLLTSLMSKRSGSAQHILIATQLREGETIGVPSTANTNGLVHSD